MQLGALEYIISIKDGGIESQINKAEKKVKGFGDRLSAFTVAKGQIIGNFATKLIQSTARIAKQTFSETVSEFGRYEQLADGAKLLYGNAFDFIADKAEKAFKTVQISQNEYLEQANAYATGLKTSLGGDAEAAAKLADRIITAQADIVSATGANREAVENGFKGLLRGNFTMLDNLQLGIKGTRAGMEEVIKSVNAWNKANGKATKYQMDNLADMNNALIDYVEMQGLAGYAGREAADTLEGSFASAKAAWKDLMTNIGRGKDIKKAAKNFGEATKKALTNLRPVIKNTVTGVFEAFKEFLPTVGEILEDLKTDLKESDIPIFRVLGEAIDKVQLAWTGLNALIDDFPGTVAKLKESDDPFAKILGGALEKGYEIFQWFLEKSGSVEGAITNIGLAFAAIKIAPGLSTFVANLLKIGSMGKDAFKHIFGFGSGGKEAPTTPTATPTKGGGIFAWAKRQIPTIAETALTVAPYALFIDGLIQDFKMIQDMTQKGAQQLEQYETKSKQYSGDEMYNLWDTLTKYTSVAGSPEDRAGMKQFAADYMRWFNDEAVNPALDRMVNAMTDEQFDRFHDVMERMNAGEMFYSDDDINTLRQAMADAISVIEGEMKKNPVKPSLDISAMQSQLNSANLKAPITPTLGGLDNLTWWKHSKGAWSVPFDNYPALLHRDETVLTKSQSRQAMNAAVSDDRITVAEMRDMLKQVKILMDGDKVADLTTKRTRKNINAQSYSRVRAYGGA